MSEHRPKVKLPAFQGDECVKGYLKLFETLVEVMDYSEKVKKAQLVSKLEGSARAWLLGYGDTWGSWDYSELKINMVSYFGEENRMHARKLQ